MTSREKRPYKLLINTLQRLDYWLQRDGVTRVIVAAETIAEIKNQTLPNHVEIIPQKRTGKRKLLRGRRHYDEQRLRLATWTKDRLDENALPFVACCTSGAVDLKIADYWLKIQAGDWVVFPAGIPKQDGSEPHFYEDYTGRSGDVLWIYSGITRFDGLNCWICRSIGEEHYKFRESDCRIEKPLLAQVFDGFCDEALGARREEYLQRMLSLVLFVLRGEIEAGNVLRRTRKLHLEKAGEISDPISEAIEYIEGNLHQHLTIDKIARQVMVSPATFTRHFKRETGKTFQQYHTERRLEIARQLLKNSNLTITDICARVGLKRGQLWALFIREHGCSPSEYRK